MELKLVPMRAQVFLEGPRALAEFFFLKQFSNFQNTAFKIIVHRAG